MNQNCEKKNMTGKVELGRFSSLLNKTKNLKEKNAKINRRKHLYSFFLHMNHSKGSLGETVGIFFFWVSKQAV